MTEPQQYYMNYQLKEYSLLRLFLLLAVLFCFLYGISRLGALMVNKSASSAEMQISMSAQLDTTAQIQGQETALSGPEGQMQPSFISKLTNGLIGQNRFFQAIFAKPQQQKPANYANPNPINSPHGVHGNNYSVYDINSPGGSLGKL
jgi:hypothetical protein